MMMKTVYVM
jgi:hypothetical protein